VKIKLDENIPHALSPALIALGHDVRTVVDQGLTGQPDDAVWTAVAREARFLVTQDVRFGGVALADATAKGGVLLLRLDSPSRAALLRRATTLFETEDVTRWHGCLVVATERKIRVR
jgi:predicted nuclease of predicted toxin-antitoxin system